MSARPTYETDETSDAQSRVLDDVAVAWRCELVPTPKFYEVDAALMRGREVMAFAEVKCRQVRLLTYPTLILSVHKWLYLRALGQRLGCRAFLVVSYVEDGIFWMDVGRAKTPKVVFGGRTDRGDAQDIEPCADIPVEWLTPLRRGG
jgi:hypothetical protein